MSQFIVLAGRWAFMLGLPAIRQVMKRTKRAYILLVSDGEILLVKGWLGRQKWQLPGGGLKSNETSQKAAIRELKEETGIDLSDSKLTLLVSGRWRTDRLGNKYEIYMTSLPARPKARRLKRELIELAWVRPTKLNSSNTTAEILDSLRAAGLV